MTGFEFPAILNKVSSLSNGDWRITFDVDSSHSQELVKLAKYLAEPLQIGIVPFPANGIVDLDVTEDDNANP